MILENVHSHNAHKHRIWRGGLDTGLHFISTTAALIIGAVSAAGAIGGAAIKARAAGKAVNAQVTAGEKAAGLFTGTDKPTATGGTEHKPGATELSVTGVEDATKKAVSDVEAAGKAGQTTLKDVYTKGGEALDPYLAAGKSTIEQQQAGMAPGGEFNRNFALTDYQADPGYAFRLQQGQQALERSASARGQVLGGGTLKSLARYSQGMASQEYQNAYTRFMEQNAARFGRLSNVSGMGLTATSQLNQLGEWYGTTSSNLGMEGATTGGQFRMGGARDAGNFRMRGAEDVADAYLGIGNARAAGANASGNAWAQGIGGATSGFLNALALSQLMKPKVSSGDSTTITV